MPWPTPLPNRKAFRFAYSQKANLKYDIREFKLIPI